VTRARGFAVAMLLLALGLAGCPGASLPKPPAMPGRPAAEAGAVAAAAMPPADTGVADLRKQREEALAEGDAADARADALERRINEKTQEERAGRLEWFGLACIVLAGLSVAAAIWLPVGKKTATAFAGMFGTMAAIAYALGEVLGWLPWALGGTLLLGALVAIVRLGPRLHLLAAVQPHLGEIEHRLSDRGKRLARKLAKA
jgi:hypothetical protein